MIKIYLILLTTFGMQLAACAEIKTEKDTDIKYKYINEETISSTRRPTLVNAEYLKAASVAYTHLSNELGIEDVSSHIVVIEEEADDYKVVFLVPRTTPVAGGGTVTYKVDKKSFEINNYSIAK
jgi:hypothetical protein